MANEKTHLGLEYGWDLGTFFKTGMDANIRRISALLHNYAISITQSDPPSGAADGDIYIVASGGTNDWNGQDNNIAHYNGYSSQWEFIQPEFGMHMYVKETALGIPAVYIYEDSTGWMLDEHSQRLLDNFSIVVINMGGGNYTMTETEARALVKVIGNSGVPGATLKYPSGAYPLDQFVLNISGNTVKIEDATGTKIGIVYKALWTDYFYSDGVYSFSGYDAGANWARFMHGGNQEISDASYSISIDDAGLLSVFTSASPQTLTVVGDASGYDFYPNQVIHGFVRGAGGLTITNDTDVDLYGPTSIAQDESFTLKRSGETDTWYVIK